MSSSILMSGESPQKTPQKPTKQTVLLEHNNYTNRKCYFVVIFVLGISTAKISKALRLFKLMNIASDSKTSFYHHVGNYINPVIIQQWKEHQQSLVDKLVDKEEVVLAGDGRCDLPGHTAKFGSYTLLEQQTNRVLDFQLVQVGMCFK